MKVWFVSEAYSQHDDEREVSSFVELAKTVEEADAILKRMVFERIEENILWEEDFTDEDGNFDQEGYDKEKNRIADEIVGDGIGHNGDRQWFRYVGNNETFAWNTGWTELKD